MPTTKDYQITLDTKYKITGEPISLVRGDTNGNIFNFIITENGVPIDLTNSTVTITMLKPDNTVVLGGCTLTDAVNGKCTYTVSNQAIAAIGTVVYTLEMYINGTRTTTTQAKFKVINELDNGEGSTSSNEYNVLSDLIVTVNETENNIIANDVVRNENEQIRQANEAIRISQESTRQNQEATRQGQEAARESAEDLRESSFNLIKDSYTRTGPADMQKAVYDSDDDGVVDVAELANSVPWTGITGKPSIVTQETINDLAGSGRTTETIKGNADAIASVLNQLNTHKVDYVAQPADCGISTGTSTAYEINSAINPTSFVDRMGAVFTCHLNSGENPTLKWGTLAAAPVKKANGNAAVLKEGSIYSVRYNTTTQVFILQSEGGEYGTALASDVRNTKSFGTDAGVIQGTLDLTNLTADNVKKDVTIGDITGNKLLYGVGDVANKISQNISYFSAGFTTSSNTNIVADSVGNIYTTTPNYLYKYSSTGTLLWSYSCSSSKNFLYIDSSDNLYYSYDLHVNKIPAGNDPNTTAPTVVTATTLSVVCTFVVIDDNTFYIGTNSGSVEYHVNKVRQWTYTVSSAAAIDIAYDYKNNRLIAKSRYTGKYTIDMVNASGITTIVTHPTGTYASKSLAIDSNGNIYIAVSNLGMIYKYSSNGTLLWSLSAYMDSTVAPLYIDNDDNVVFVAKGTSSNTFTSSNAATIKKIRSDGILQFTHRLEALYSINNCGYVKKGIFVNHILICENLPWLTIMQVGVNLTD